MALILEVLAAGRHGGRHAEVRERHRLDGAPLAIGRGLDNQVVLDDPHVDARHARLEPDAEGGWALVDLGSVNRMLVPHAGRTDRLVVRPGTVVTLGRTTLRFRDEFAPVAAAVPLAPAIAPAFDWAGTARGRAAVIVGALAIGTVRLWLATTTRGAASQVFAELLVAMVLVGSWAGAWSVAARIVLGRFNYLSHVAIAAAAAVAAMVVSDLAEWVRFLLPALPATDGVEGLALMCVLGALVALHLSAASHLSRPARWRSGAVTVGVILVLAGIGAALEEETYTPEARFDGELKMITPALVPQQGMDDFAATRAELKAEVDKLLAEE